MSDQPRTSDNAGAGADGPPAASDREPGDAGNPRKLPLKKLAPTGALGVVWATAPAVLGIVLLGKLGTVSDWLTAHPQAGLAAYVAVFVLASGTGLLPTYAQAILGGWVFGVAAGLPAALVGFAGGALVGFIIVRVVSRDDVEEVVEANPKAKAVRDALIGHGPWRTLGIVALLRMPPNSPFALTNLAMASTGVSAGPFLAGTAIGMLPRTAVAVGLAAAASATGARDIQTFAAERGLGLLIAGAVAMIIVLAIIGAIAKRAVDRVTGGAKSGE